MIELWGNDAARLIFQHAEHPIHGVGTAAVIVQIMLHTQCGVGQLCAEGNGGTVRILGVSGAIRVFVVPQSDLCSAAQQRNILPILMERLVSQSDMLIIELCVGPFPVFTGFDGLVGNPQ